jgi:hypothetical protein
MICMGEMAKNDLRELLNDIGSEKKRNNQDWNSDMN